MTSNKKQMRLVKHQSIQSTHCMQWDDESHEILRDNIVDIHEQQSRQCMQLMRRKDWIVHCAWNVSLLATLKKILLQSNERNNDNDDLSFKQLRRHNKQQTLFVVNKHDDDKLESIACNDNQNIALIQVARLCMRFEQLLQFLFNDRSMS